MANYYVDYENVNFAGFLGVRELRKRDKIFVFCREEQIAPIKEKFVNIGDVKPNITYIAVEGNNPNALDFQLVTYIGLHIKKKDLSYIISEDRGYDPAVSMLRNEGYLVYRRKNVTAEYEPLELYRKCYDLPPIEAKKRKYGKSVRVKE